MEGQAEQSAVAVAETARLNRPSVPERPLPPPDQPSRATRDGFLLPGTRPRRPTVGRRIGATLAFAVVYLLLLVPCFFAVTALSAWQMLHWLLFGELLVPVLWALGLVGLFKGMVPCALLIGAVAVRTPELLWPKLLAAVLLPAVDLMLLRRALFPELLLRGLSFLMDPRAMIVLGTLAPLAGSGLAALLVPRRLLRKLLRTLPERTSHSGRQI